MTTKATSRPSGEICGSLTKRMRVRSCGTIARGVGMGRMIRQGPHLDKRRSPAVSSGRHGARRSDPHRALTGEVHHAAAHLDVPRNPAHARTGLPGPRPGAAALEAGAAGRDGQLASGAHRPAARPQGARRDPGGQDQGAAGLQGRRSGRTGSTMPGSWSGATRAPCSSAAAWRGTSTRCWTRAASARSRSSPRASTAQRGGLQGRHALRGGGAPDHQDGGDRGQARQPARHGRGLRHAAQGSAARLEVPGLRAGRQALLQHRRALQHLHPARHPRQHLAREPRRQRLRVLRARRAQQRGIRLASR